MSPKKPRTRTRTLAALAVLAAIVAGAAWGALFRVVPARHPTPVAAFKHGSVGVEASAGIPYWIWVVLPRVFPEHLPGPGGYTALGLAWEDGDELPVGFSKTTGGYPRVAPNCAFCHTSTWRGTPDAPRAVVPGGPASMASPEAYQRFLAASARDPRFTAENLMPEIEYLVRLSAAERVLYRNVLIPRTQRALLRQARETWRHGRPDAGPGRSDVVSPVKFTLLRRPADRTIGTADIPALWGLAARHGQGMGWDGLNPSAREMVVGSALAVGASRAAVRPGALEALVDASVGGTPPPRFPAPVDAALASRGERVYAESCAGCHGTHGAWTGRLVPLTRPDETEAGGRIATDPGRAAAWDRASAERLNRYTAGYDWKLERFRDTDGYVAPPLDGIWLRAPYLHNGSVPTLWHLLRPAERPQTFYRGYDVIDPVRVGFRYDVPHEEGRRFFLYDTRLPGNSNRGHEFGASLPEEEKAALLEYLKTL
jgi:mono/diheme cytochrome c family protein